MSLPFEDDGDRLAQLQTLGGQFRVSGHLIWGILQEDYLDQSVGSGHSVNASQPILLARDIDTKDVEVDAEVDEIAGKRRSFIVGYPPEPDGTGMVRFRLQDR